MVLCLKIPLVKALNVASKHITHTSSK